MMVSLLLIFSSFAEDPHIRNRPMVATKVLTKEEIAQKMKENHLTKEQVLKNLEADESKLRGIAGAYVQRFYESFMESYLKNMGLKTNPFPDEVFQNIKNEVITKDKATLMYYLKDHSKINADLLVIVNRHLRAFLDTHQSKDAKELVAKKNYVPAVDNKIGSEKSDAIVEDVKNSSEEKTIFQNIMQYKFLIMAIIFLVIIFLKKS